MTLFVILLLTLSAFIHAGWNFICKKNEISIAHFLRALLSAYILVLPFLFLFRGFFPLYPLAFWGMIAGTGFCMALYHSSLAAAYRHGDLSLGYPMLRALPVLLIPAITILFRFGQTPSFTALFGMGCVAVGCFILPGLNHRLNKKSFLWIGYAVLAAIGTAGYTIIDDRALALIGKTPGIILSPAKRALCYMPLEFLSGCIWLFLFALCIPQERRTLFTKPFFIKDEVFMGIAIYIGYILVLASMPLVTNVSYVAAYRQLSIPIGVWLGIMVLKEKISKSKILGTLLLLFGLLIIALRS
jgi:drug/metabolite transporter (DMT)-like permease